MMLVLQEQSQQVLCFQYSNASKELNSRGSEAVQGKGPDSANAGGDWRPAGSLIDLDLEMKVAAVGDAALST